MPDAPFSGNARDLIDEIPAGEVQRGPFTIFPERLRTRDDPMGELRRLERGSVAPRQSIRATKGSA